MMADKEGFWGPVTSTLDWCEENYHMSPYIAEFWNTISNLAMIVPPLIMLTYAYYDKLEKRAFGCLLGLTAVGIGSWLFHMTLLYSMQLMDEMPMLWGSTFLIYALWELNSVKSDNTLHVKLYLLAYCSLYSVIYLTLLVPLIHQVAYGLMVVFIVFRSLYICRYMSCSLPLAGLGLFSYALGFLCWNIDNHFCPHIREYRSSVPYGAITQLHAWWHLLAGMGTYFCLMFTLHARLLFLKKECKFTHFIGIPCIRQLPPV